MRRSTRHNRGKRLLLLTSFTFNSLKGFSTSTLHRLGSKFGTRPTKRVLCKKRQGVRISQEDNLGPLTDAVEGIRVFTFY